jgi:hypothetical protein
MHLYRREHVNDFDLPSCFSGIPSPTKDHQSLMEGCLLATLRGRGHLEDKAIKREGDYEIKAGGFETVEPLDGLEFWKYYPAGSLPLANH